MMFLKESESFLNEVTIPNMVPGDFSSSREGFALREGWLSEVYAKAVTVLISEDTATKVPDQPESGLIEPVVVNWTEEEMEGRNAVVLGISTTMKVQHGYRQLNEDPRRIPARFTLAFSIFEGGEVKPYLHVYTGKSLENIHVGFEDLHRFMTVVSEAELVDGSR